MDIALPTEETYEDLIPPTPVFIYNNKLVYPGLEESNPNMSLLLVKLYPLSNWSRLRFRSDMDFHSETLGFSSSLILWNSSSPSSFSIGSGLHFRVLSQS